MRDDERDEIVKLLAEYAEYLDEHIVRPSVASIVEAIDRTERPKTVRHMWGEYLREAAVLVLVFVPLELLGPKILGHSLTWNWVISAGGKKWLGGLAITLIGSYILMRWGMRLERGTR